MRNNLSADYRPIVQNGLNWITFLLQVTRDQLKPLYGLREFFEEVNEVHASRKKENPIEKDSNKNYCRKHEDQELEFFCYECCREICGLCWDSDHGDVKSHLVQRIDYAKQRILVNILENVNIETRTQEVHDRIASVQGTILLLEDLMRSMTREYTSLVQELITCEDVAKLDEKERDIMLSQSKFDAENELQKQIIGLRKSITDSRISEKEKAISYEVWTRIAKLDGEVIEDNKSTSMKPTQKLSGYFNNMMQKVKSSLTDNQNTSTPLGGEDMLPL